MSIHNHAVFINVSIIELCNSVHKGILDPIIAQCINVHECKINQCSGMCHLLHSLSVFLNAQFISVQEGILYHTFNQCSGMYP